jgi:hypothetical protein
MKNSKLKCCSFAYLTCVTKRLGVFLGAPLAMAVKILSFVPAQL